MADDMKLIRLPYDPGAGEGFWRAVEGLPGYPGGVQQPIREMLFESGAIYRLGEVLAKAGATRSEPVLIVMDATPMRRGGESLKPLVQGVLSQDGWRPEEAVLQTGASGQVHTDLLQIRAVESRLREGMAVLSLGSGTVTDIAKHACFEHARQTGYRPPLVVFQTANSVSAYTSNMAPVFVDGVKRTLASRYPDGLVCDLETLCEAPPEMTAAGVGDLLAAFVSLPDWYLAHRLGMNDAYSPLPEALIGPLDEILVSQAEGIRRQTPDGMAVLAKLIALGGLAMSLAGTTAPMSGLEHAMSHGIDLVAERRGRPLAAHGSQVALAAILCCEAYRRFLEAFRPEGDAASTRIPDARTARAGLESAFRDVDPQGGVAQACWPEYEAKLRGWASASARRQESLGRWAEVRAEMERRTRPPERLVEILSAVGAPMAFDQLVPPIPEGAVRSAFRSAPYLRNRVTLGDLFLFVGWDREHLWQEIWRRGVALGQAGVTPGS